MHSQCQGKRIEGRFAERPRAHLITLRRLRWIPWLLPILEWASVKVLVLIGGVFFRAETLEKAWFITTHMFNFRGVSLGQLYNLGLPSFEMTRAFLWIVFLMIVDHCLSNRSMWGIPALSSPFVPSPCLRHCRLRRLHQGRVHLLRVLGEDLAHHFAMNVGESNISAAETESEPFVIDS